jgi:hypothetical protein
LLNIRTGAAQRGNSTRRANQSCDMQRTSPATISSIYVCACDHSLHARDIGGLPKRWITKLFATLRHTLTRHTDKTNKPEYCK